MHRTPRRLRLRFVAAMPVLLGALTLTGVAPARAEGSGITRAPSTFPNYWWDHRATIEPGGVSDEVTVVPDATRDLAVEANITSAPNVAIYDARTGELVATGTPAGVQGQSASEYTCCTAASGGLQSRSAQLALDTVDGLFFTVASSDGTLHAYSDRTAKPVATVGMPSPPANPQVQAEGALAPVIGPAAITPIGLSWSAASDEVIVGETESGAARPIGVFLVAYDVKALLAGSTQPLWTDQVAECSGPMSQVYATADAQLSYRGNAVYVPCEVDSYLASSFYNDERDAVVRLDLSATKAPSISGALTDTITCSSAARVCPDGTTEVSVAPGTPNDFIFDPGSDRALLPMFVPGEGVDALVYDGTRGTFISKLNVGGPNDSLNVAFGLDAARGRIYALGKSDGLTTVDARRNPVTPGSRFASANGSVGDVVIGALPPDAMHAETRLVVPFEVSTDADRSCPRCGARDFAVFDDGVPVTQDPPAAPIDAQTYSGDIPNGASTATTYGGHAAGYGAHLVQVGGTSAAMQDTLAFANGGSSETLSLPLESTVDLLAGGVRRITLANGSGVARAAAVVDGNGQASAGTAECTDASAIGGCVPPPSCPQGTACPGSPAARCPSAVPCAGAGPSSSTAQQWPFPDAVCTTGSPSGVDDVATGMYGTQPSSGDAPPVQQPVPGSDAVAHAEVHCAADQPEAGSVAAAGAIHGLQSGGAGLPEVTVAEAGSDAVVAPAVSGGPTTSATTSVARGVHVDLGGGNAVDIGSIEQVASSRAAGHAGTAHTSDTVVVDHVAVTRGGTVTELCAAACPSVDDLVTTLDSEFPTLLHVMSPRADDEFAPGSGDNGSPGGYTAVVQANRTEQAGDEHFNYMATQEAVLLPAMRIVLYGFNDGTPDLDRTVLDLAGVEDDSEDGVSVFAAPTGWQTDVPTAGEQAAAGVPISAYVPGTPGTMPPIAAPAASPGDNLLAGGIPGLARRVFAGLRWLLQSPGQTLTLLAVFALLGTPLLLMARRRTALADVVGDG